MKANRPADCVSLEITDQGARSDVPHLDTPVTGHGQTLTIGLEHHMRVCDGCRREDSAGRSQLRASQTKTACHLRSPKPTCALRRWRRRGKPRHSPGRWPSAHQFRAGSWRSHTRTSPLTRPATKPPSGTHTPEQRPGSTRRPPARARPESKSPTTTNLAVCIHGHQPSLRREGEHDRTQPVAEPAEARAARRGGGWSAAVGIGQAGAFPCASGLIRFLQHVREQWQRWRDCRPERRVPAAGQQPSVAERWEEPNARRVSLGELRALEPVRVATEQSSTRTNETPTGIGTVGKRVRGECHSRSVAVRVSTRPARPRRYRRGGSSSCVTSNALSSSSSASVCKKLPIALAQDAHASAAVVRAQVVRQSNEPGWFG